MRLGPGIYLGDTVGRRTEDGLSLTVSKDAADLTDAWHVHANPTLFALIAGERCDRSRRADFVHERLTVVFHPTTEPHAGAVGPHDYRPLDTPWSSLAGACASCG
jgi:hypothetical protein